MFRLLEGDDEIGPFEVGRHAGCWHAAMALRSNAPFFKRLDDQAGDRADIGFATLDRERPGSGPPAEGRGAPPSG
jgi:hypothetical protein